jgi:CheY-like chemotaxis protein
VCGEAENAGQALDAVKASKPNLVLADITLPGKSGLELIKDIKAMRSELPVLVVSMHDESLYADRVLRAGARGYITKHEGGEKLGGKIYVWAAWLEMTESLLMTLRCPLPLPTLIERSACMRRRFTVLRPKRPLQMAQATGVFLSLWVQLLACNVQDRIGLVWIFLQHFDGFGCRQYG